MDCRTIVIPDKKYFDVAICVYDVIGSFPDEDDNLKVLKNIYNHLYSGGYAGNFGYEYGINFTQS